MAVISFAGDAMLRPNVPKLNAALLPCRAKLSAKLMEALVQGHAQVRENCVAHKPKLNTAKTHAQTGKFTAWQ